MNYSLHLLTGWQYTRIGRLSLGHLAMHAVDLMDSCGLIIVAAGDMLILVPLLSPPTTTTKPAPNDINVTSISVEMGGFENQTACY